MKNRSTKLAGLILALFTLLGFTVTAQCPQFSNALSGTGCSVQIKVEAYSNCNNNCSGGCTTVCNSYVTTVGPGSFISLNCMGCTCVIVRVLQIGSVPVLPVPWVDNGNNPGAPTGAPNLPGTCGANYLYWDSGSNTFKVIP